MLTIWNWIKNNPNRFMFLIPIVLVAIISISHVVTWYDMANPIMWAVYLSVAIEIAAMTALVAASSRITSGIWLMFGLVTFIQIIGNVFYSFKEINEAGALFKSWVELTSPVWELLGTEITDVVSLKRWLAFLTGGLLPVISLTSLHFFITFDKEEKDNNESNDKYFEARNKEIVNVVMSKPKDTEFNTPYPFTNEMKEGIKKSEEATVEENIVAGDDYDSEGNLHFTPREPAPPIEDEGKVVLENITQEMKKIEEEKKEEEILESMKKAEELVMEEEKKKIELEDKRKEEEIIAARKKAEEWVRKEADEKKKFEEKRKQEDIEKKKAKPFKIDDKLTGEYKRIQIQQMAERKRLITQQEKNKSPKVINPVTTKNKIIIEDKRRIN